MQVAKWGVNRMPIIGKAWKANVNVWKRHLTLQSVFNRSECMMHVDKNADDHVVDRISREIAYVPLGGGIRSKRSSCMQFFFFLNEYKIRLPGGRRILAHVFKGLRIFGLWLMFSKDQRFWILAHVFRGLRFLDLGSCFQRTKVFWGFGSCFQRTKGFGSWLMFSTAQDFGALAHVFRGPKVLDAGSCFQRPRIFGSWLMFSEDQEFFGL